MNRRRYLGMLAGVAGGVAGCTGMSPRSGSPGEAASTPTTTGGPSTTSVGDVDLPVPTTEMRNALPRDHIPAIVDPAFASDWSGLALPEESRGESTELPPDAPVVGVERAGDARAYPLRVLDWHEVVNDDFHGPVLVTYCVLCGSAVVGERVVRGSPTVFGVSGYLWRSALVLYDRATDSLWSQLLATAVNGPATGERFDLLPSGLTTWGKWRNRHPATEVLLPPPRSNTVRGPDATFDYFTPKYSYGDEDQLIGYDSDDGTLHPRTLVVGVTSGDSARAYPHDQVVAAGVVNDTVGELPVVVAAAPGGTLVAYSRRIDDSVLAFAADGTDDAHMLAGGSRWRRSTGVARDGPYQGRRLRPANDLPPMFWRGWSNIHPDSTVYGRTGGESTGTRTSPVTDDSRSTSPE